MIHDYFLKISESYYIRAKMFRQPIGVNLGGLGTLIASLASLISFKFYANTDGSNKKRYLGIISSNILTV